MAMGAVEALIAFLGILAAGFGAFVFGQRKGRKDQSNEMRVRDHENADAVRSRVADVRVSKDDIQYRD